MMKERRYFLLACQLFVLGFLVVWNNVLGIGQGFYWSVWWWDIVSHILGGLWVGLCAAWIAAYFQKRISILACVVAALSVGVAWEIFEYLTGSGASIFMSYTADTIKDLVDDVIGGTAAGYFVSRRP